MPLQVIPRRDRKLNSLIKAATPEVYRKGGIIYQQGDPAGLVLLVREGHVRLTLPKTGADNGRSTRCEILKSKPKSKAARNFRLTPSPISYRD